MNESIVESWRERAISAEAQVHRLKVCVEDMAREIAYMAVFRPELPPEEAREYAARNWRKFVPVGHGHLFTEDVPRDL